MSPSRPSGLLLLHLAVLLVGFAGLFGKWIAVNALVMVAGRLVFAVPVLALVVWWRTPSSPFGAGDAAKSRVTSPQGGGRVPASTPSSPCGRSSPQGGGRAGLETGRHQIHAGRFLKWFRIRGLWVWRRFFLPPGGGGQGGGAGGFLPPAGRDRWLLWLNGAVLAAHWVSFFHAVQVSTVAVALLGYASAPVFAAVMEPLGYRERFSGRALAASALILLGAGLIVPEWRWDAAILQGMLWGLLSGWTFAVLQLLNRRLVRARGSLVLALQLDAVALLVLLPFLPGAWQTPSWSDWGLMAIQGVVFTVGAHTLFIEALHTVRAQTVAIVSTLEPVYGIAAAAWLLAEIPDGRTALGGALILAAVVWTTLRFGSHSSVN